MRTRDQLLADVVAAALIAAFALGVLAIAWLASDPCPGTDEHAAPAVCESSGRP